MARKPPPPHRKGAPRTPGSGRKKGTPNRKTVEIRELMAALLHDTEYQSKLRADFRRRRIHPTTEVAIWNHVLGKPKQEVAVSADVAMQEKLAAERKLYEQLSVEQLEELVRESEALVAKARAMANGTYRPNSPTK